MAEIFNAPLNINTNDISTNAATGTPGLTTALSTTVKYIGTGSWSFDGTDTSSIADDIAGAGEKNGVTWPHIAAYDLGDAPFTIQGHVRFNDSTDQVFMSDYRSTGSERVWYLRRMTTNGGTWRFGWYFNGVTISTLEYIATIDIDRWYHIAVVREVAVPATSSRIVLYLDGTRVGDDLVGALAFHSATPVNLLRMGQYDSGATSLPLNGYMDNWSIHTETLYTEDFTPPMGGGGAMGISTPSGISIIPGVTTGEL